MSHDNPLLADDILPAFSQICPEHVTPAIETILAEYRAGIDALLAPGAPRDFAAVMLTQERLEQRLAREGRAELAAACFAFLPARARLDLAGWREEDIFAH